MKKIAIVGCRPGAGINEDIVREYIRSLSDKDKRIIVSGGAEGVDTWAVQEARSLGIRTKVIPPKKDLSPKYAPLERNTRIAEECDWMVVFWDGKSPGTRDVITKAAALGKTVIINPGYKNYSV